MPTLKDVKCSIELSESQRALQEFGTTYGDGFVETFVPVPSKPQSFCVHLTSDKFIAPGISMYVFVDGVYQCNRNRQDLKLRKGSDSRSMVDFRVRQKEEKQKDGSMIAREWKFEKLDITSADGAPEVCSPNVLDNIGCIEVLILRCAGPRNAKTVSAMALDGASDMPSYPFGLDGQPRTPDSRSMYDDRGPFYSGGGNDHRPPPPIPSYRSPYAETVHSRDMSNHSHHNTGPAMEASPFAPSNQHRSRSRYSEPISPGARPPMPIPSEAFHYGSGPIPPGPMMGSERTFYHTRPASAVVTNAPGVDPAWLNEMLTKAVKRGVEEVRRTESSPEAHRKRAANVETARHPPGAWPQSPFSPVAQPVDALEYAPRYDIEEDSGATWGSSEGRWGDEQPRDKPKGHVNWIEEPVRDSQTRAGGWTGPEETASETWDTDETWGTKKPEMRRASQWNKSKAPTVRSGFEQRAQSPVTTRPRQSRYSNDVHRSNKSRSKSQPTSSKWSKKRRPLSEDPEGWIRVDAESDSLSSWEATDDTEQPSQPRSHGRTSRKRSQSRKKSHHTRPTHSDDRKSSRHVRGGGGSEATSKQKYAPSMASGGTPTVMNAPLNMQQPVYPPQIPRRVSNYAEPNSTQAPPPQGWNPAPPESFRRQSYGTPHIPLAPFSVNREDFKRCGSSASWDKKYQKEKPSWSTTSRPDKHHEVQDPWNTGNENKRGWDTQVATSWEDIDTDAKGKNGWKAAKYGSGWNGNSNGWEATDESKKQNTDAKVSGGWNTGSGYGNTTKNADSQWDTQTKAWNNNGTSTKAKEVQWNSDAWNKDNDIAGKPQAQSDTNPWGNIPPPPPEPNPSKPASTSKRHTSKSLSKYRQNRSASDVGPKSHWQFPPPPSSRKLPSISETLPPEPPLKISSTQASEKGIEHQVRAGAGSQYGHTVGRPEYLDTLDKPYAVFRFKYRTRKVLKDMFGDEVPDHGHLTRHTETSKVLREKEKLKDVSKEELIEKMVKLKMRNEGKDRKQSRDSGHKSRVLRRAVSENTESVARDLTESWVKQHSRDPSEKGSMEKKEREDQGWNSGGGWADPNKWS